MNIGQDGSSYNNQPFVCVRKNLFCICIVISLSYFSLKLLSITDLILYINSYFDTRWNEQYNQNKEI